MFDNNLLAPEWLDDIMDIFDPLFVNKFAVVRIHDDPIDMYEISNGNVEIIAFSNKQVVYNYLKNVIKDSSIYFWLENSLILPSFIKIKKTNRKINTIERIIIYTKISYLIQKLLKKRKNLLSSDIYYIDENNVDNKITKYARYITQNYYLNVYNINNNILFIEAVNGILSSSALIYYLNKIFKNKYNFKKISL